MELQRDAGGPLCAASDGSARCLDKINSKSRAGSGALAKEVAVQEEGNAKQFASLAPAAAAGAIAAVTTESGWGAGTPQTSFEIAEASSGAGNNTDRRPAATGGLDYAKAKNQDIDKNQDQSKDQSKEQNQQVEEEKEVMGREQGDTLGEEARAEKKPKTTATDVGRLPRRELSSVDSTETLMTTVSNASSQASALSIENFQLESPEFDILTVPAEALVMTFARVLYEFAVERQGLQNEISLTDIECFVHCTSRFYKSQNPFHNFHHACSVTQAVGCLVTQIDEFSPHERLLLCLIALCHDAGHLGLSNRYLAQRFGNVVTVHKAESNSDANDTASASTTTTTTSTNSALSTNISKSAQAGAICPSEESTSSITNRKQVRKNEESKYRSESDDAEGERGGGEDDAENMDVEDEDDYDSDSDTDGKATVEAAKAAMYQPITDPREVVSRNGVLSTMEKHHVKIAHKLLRHHPVILSAIAKGMNPGGTSEGGMQIISAYVLVTILCTDLTVHDTLLNDLARSNEGETSLRSKLRLAALIMHCADLSNPSRSFEVNYEWSLRLDEERRLLESSTDPSAPSEANELPSVGKFSRGEVGFIERLIEPSWVRLAQVSESTKVAVEPWLNALRKNLWQWKKLASEGEVSDTPANQRRRTVSSTRSLISDTDDFCCMDRVHESKTCSSICACAESPDACCYTDTRALKLACTRSFIMRTPASQICCTILEKDRIGSSTGNGSVSPSQIA